MSLLSQIFNDVLTYPILNGLMALYYLIDLNLNWFSAWHISLGLPDPTHILPILAGVITVVQIRMSQPPNLAETRETLQQASHITQLLLPLFMGGITIFFAWQFAAGVALYRLAYLVLSTLRQYFITGWGSLWVLPRFATFIPDTSTRVTPPIISSSATRRRKSGTRRRHPKRGR